MKTIRNIFCFIALLIISGCYGPLTGTVIDAETKQPISGAVVYAEWVVEKGIGFTHTETYKVVEVETDKDGKFSIDGTYSLRPSLELLALIVYKPGYVAWQNKFIYRFPEEDLRRRTDFHWSGSNHIFELEKFKNTYSHAEHLSFFRGGLSLNSSSKLDQAISLELPLSKKELGLYWGKIEAKKYSSNREIYKEIMNELFPQGGSNK